MDDEYRDRRKIWVWGVDGPERQYDKLKGARLRVRVRDERNLLTDLTQNTEWLFL